MMTQTPSDPYSFKFLFSTSKQRKHTTENWPPLYDILHPIDTSMDLQRFYPLVWAKTWPYEILLASLHWNSGASPLHWTIFSSIAVIWKKYFPPFMNLFKMEFRQTPISRLPISADHHNHMLSSLHPNSSPVQVYALFLSITTTAYQESHSKLDRSPSLYHLTFLTIYTHARRWILETSFWTNGLSQRTLHVLQNTHNLMTTIINFIQSSYK